MSVLGKVFCSMLFNRVKTHVDQRLREEQAGFRSGRSCTEQIPRLRNIIEQSRKWQKDVFVNFVYFKKAFDSIHRDTLWKSCSSTAYRTYSRHRIVYLLPFVEYNAVNVGLRISADKTKAMAVGSTQAVSLSVERKDIESV